MHVLVVSKSKGLRNQFRLSKIYFVLAACISAAILATVSYWSFHFGTLTGLAAEPGAIKAEILSQKSFLKQLETDMHADLEAFSQSTAQLHGYLSRLDAVADRVLRSSNVDSGEFSFGNPSPSGGPVSNYTKPPKWNDLLDNISALEAEIEKREGRLSMLESFLLDKESQESVSPVGRPVRNGWISSIYGYRIHPISGRREFHSGIDFAGKPDTFVRAVASGVVTWSGSRWGYGNLVEINHGNGYLTRYAHNKENLAELGQKVKKSEAIALLGSSGMSTGPHVHFEVMFKDKHVDPQKFINEYGD